jgi:hypothetical protein
MESSSRRRKTVSHDRKAAAIRSLNDELRKRGCGGRVFITRGLLALGDAAVKRVIDAIAAFDAFTPDNDPHGEHDCAVLIVDGIKVFWKIDYYDLAGEFGSEDPADPAKTKRVLTLMLASEY